MEITQLGKVHYNSVQVLFETHQLAQSGEHWTTVQELAG